MASILVIAVLAGCATAPPGPHARANPDANTADPVVTQDANGVPAEMVPRRVPRVGLGVGPGRWGSGLGISPGF